MSVLYVNSTEDLPELLAARVLRSKCQEPGLTEQYDHPTYTCDLAVWSAVLGEDHMMRVSPFQVFFREKYFALNIELMRNGCRQIEINLIREGSRKKKRKKLGL